MLELDVRLVSHRSCECGLKTFDGLYNAIGFYPPLRPSSRRSTNEIQHYHIWYFRDTEFPEMTHF